MKNYIQKFDITDNKILFQIALNCARIQGTYLARNIDQFLALANPKFSQAQLVEIALVCAEEREGGLAAYIQLFAIHDLEVLAKIAELCARNSSWALAENFDKFLSLHKFSKKDRIKLARICSQNMAHNFGQYLEKFEIKDRQVLLDLAYLYAENGDVGDLYENIEKFQIEFDKPFNQQELTKLARIAVKNNPEAFCCVVEHCGVLSVEERYNLARKCAEKCAEFVCERFGDFFPGGASSLSTEKRKELAFLTAQASAHDLGKNLWVFEIHDEDILRELFYVYVLHGGATALIYIDQFITKLDESWMSTLQRIALNVSFDRPEKLRVMLEEVFDSSIVEDQRKLNKILTLFFACSLSRFYPHEETIKSFQSPYYRQIRSALISKSWFLRALRISFEEVDSYREMKKQMLAYIALSTINKEMLQNASVKQAVYRCVLHGNTTTALRCIYMMGQSFNQRTVEVFSDLVQSLSKTAEPSINATLFLPMINIAIWIEREKLHTTDEVIQQLKKRLVVKQVRSILKDGQKRLEENWVKVCKSISESSLYTNLEGIELLTRVLELPNPERLNGKKLKLHIVIIKRLNFLNILIQQGVRVELKSAQRDVSDQLGALVGSKLLENKYLDLRQVEDLDSKYVATIQSGRYPNAWKIYQLSIEKSREETVQTAFQRFITGVLNGVFLEQRYGNTNFHVETILNQHSKVWKLWQAHDKPTAIKVDKASYLLEKTDQWEDLLLSGSEHIKSCQDIEGEQCHNKGLLGTLLEGKNQLIIIRDPNTKQIVSRAIIRLLWDPVDEKPTLFVENVYPHNEKRFVEHIYMKASQVALKLGVQAYVDAMGAKKALELESLGGISPYEYSDAYGGLAEEGVYKVSAIPLADPLVVSSRPQV